MKKSHLYIDIETVKDPTIPDSLFSIAEEKNPQQINFLPTYNQIISISIGWLKDNAFTTRSLKGTEPEMITELFKYVDKFTLTGFWILWFDIPFICMRALKYSIEIPIGLKVYWEKPWTMQDKFLDLMIATKFTGTRYYNLNDVCLLLDIPTPKDWIDWSQVQDFYNQWRLTEIEQYCCRDVEASYLLHRKLIDLKVLD